MTKATNMLFRYAYHPDGRRLEEVGIYADGTLRNPHGYPEDDVREAVMDAVARWRANRSEAAKKAAATRARRRELLVHQIARRIVERTFEPGQHCALCRRGLTDPASQARGIGPECWEDVLRAVETLRMAQGVKR